MNKYQRPVLAGGILGIVAGVYSYLRFISSGVNTDPGWVLLVPASGVSSAILGIVLWWWLVDRPDQWTVSRGVISGALTAVLAHPLTWYLLMVINWVRGERTSLGERTLDPLQAIAASAVYSVGSLLVAGTETFLIGGLCGVFIVYMYRRISPEVGVGNV
ncbi:hypothetical protein ACFQJC_17025 [Haloferax namakaokahaiae]|uniref:Uncharacterized protein n=1 Tax=Haloferax namakaokahaiae TaxID=1748331 RepID=A0ABD5ZIT2_9EURY